MQKQTIGARAHKARSVWVLIAGCPPLPPATRRAKPRGARPDGSTGAVKVVSSTIRHLNRASVDAVSRWKFEPVDDVLTVETELDYKYE